MLFSPIILTKITFLGSASNISNFIPEGEYLITSPFTGTLPAMLMIKPPKVSISSLKSSFLIDDIKPSSKSIIILASTITDPSSTFSNLHSEDKSCSSSISPTSSSTKSSIVTKPSIPPYSSTTRARWRLLFSFHTANLIN